MNKEGESEEKLIKKNTNPNRSCPHYFLTLFLENKYDSQGRKRHRSTAHCVKGIFHRSPYCLLMSWPSQEFNSIVKTVSVLIQLGMPSHIKTTLIIFPKGMQGQPSSRSTQSTIYHICHIFHKKCHIKITLGRKVMNVVSFRLVFLIECSCLLLDF